jgi:regulator of protease activity HflC (stomatin/prohibitin superfamily)
METLEIIEIVFIAIVAIALIIVYKSFYTVNQGSIAVLTTFGKYKRMALPGFGFKNPFTEQIFKRISIQNKTIEIEFTAITQDQANVDFKAMLLYSTLNDKEETIKKVAFKFVDEASFMQALIRSVEASIRSFVSTKKQNEILGLREDIVAAVKSHLDIDVEDWGYRLIDLQINDILFDEAIMRSMAQVVASENLKSAALNEGQAHLIKKTKEAEAEKISTILKGEGIAKMEDILSTGMVEASNKLKGADLNYSLLQFTNWTDSMKHIAEHGSGNVIFFDGSTEGLQKTIKQTQAVSLIAKNGKA